MALAEPLCGILNMGIQKEQAARQFYRRAAENTRQPLGRKMFKRLADEESKHERLLADWAAKGTCPAGATFAPPDPSMLKRGQAKVDQIGQADTGDLEAIELARDMERKAIRFYVDAAAKAPDPASKDLLLKLKGEEDKHLALLTDLYEYMRNPHLWSVRDERAHFDA
jgi:rubrerythrin